MCEFQITDFVYMLGDTKKFKVNEPISIFTASNSRRLAYNKTIYNNESKYEYKQNPE